MGVIIGILIGIGVSCIVCFVYKQFARPVCTCGPSPNRMCKICSVRSSSDGTMYKLTETEMKHLNRRYKWK